MNHWQRKPSFKCMAPLETFLRGPSALKELQLSSFLASVVPRACRTPSTVVAPKDTPVDKHFWAKPRRDAMVHSASSGQAACCCTSATSIEPRKRLAHLLFGTCEQGPTPGAGKRRSCWSQPDRHILGYFVISMQGFVMVLSLRSSIFHADYACVYAVFLERYSLLRQRDFCAAAPFCQLQ